MRRTVVRATFPYPLIWDSGELEICAKDKPFDVIFERRYREATDERQSGSRILSAPGSELPYDRLGRVAHTHVEIRFPMYVEHDITNREELWNWVHAVINRLLSVYRYTMEEFYIDTVPKDEMDIQAISTIDEHGTLVGGETLIGFQAVSNDRWLTPARTEPIPEEARQILRSGAELPISKVLFLNASREYLLEDYRIAVVEAETAFEALIDQVVAHYYRQQGVSNTEIQNKLQAPLANLIEHHIRRCCGEAFLDTPEHEAWRNELYELRHRVVHDGASITAQQAQRALNVAEAAMAWIETRTPPLQNSP
jgi:hypothetical protein